MPINFEPQTMTFHLQNNFVSYIVQIINEGYLVHRYWGKRVNAYHNSNPLVFLDRGFSPNPDPSDRTFSLDTVPLEYPAYGNGDYRLPSFQVQLEDGSTVTDLRYKTHKVLAGKPALEGLPSTYVESDKEAETLEITLEDSLTGLLVILSYTIFNDFGVITRNARFCNMGKNKLTILRAFSASVDFCDDEFDMLTLYGSHINERNIARHAIVPGTQMIESTRGSSSHQQNPFFALLRHNTDEDTGEVYAFSLVYSGNFSAQVQVDQFKTSRAAIGINPFDFEWILEDGEAFQTPETVMVYSANGLGNISRTFHQLYRTHLCRGHFRDAVRPILINNWEATYFDFTVDKIVEIAKAGSELGMELLVLDDGWFGKRSDDRSSLGDWFVNKEKLPGGLAPLADCIQSLGMKFGLWFEPEMVSENSILYRNHPDWCLHVQGRSLTEGRSQFVLDLSRKDVCDYIVQSLCDVLSSAKISYVKWDMNRHMTEIGSAILPPKQQRETAHRYMLGLYHVLEMVTAHFPDILFESCSGGGGRFDPGMLYYMPQVWTSDNTDAICRLKIQYGTSLAYPAITMASHVSAVPNQQVGRITPLETRGNVAMSGNLGYELDLTQLSDDEKELVKQQILLYKTIRPLVQFGDLYRILSPFEGNEASWSYISKDQSKAIIFYFRVLAQPGASIRTLRCKGLDPDYSYRDEVSGNVYGGDELMNVGFTVPFENGDFISRIWRFTRYFG